MTLRLAANVGAIIATAIVAMMALVVAATAQDCGEQQIAYNDATAALGQRANQLGITQADTDRLREDIEAAGTDGVINDAESAEILRDPVVVRIQEDFQSSDLDLIRNIARTKNALNRCQGVVVSSPSTSATATTTATTTTSATSTSPTSSAAPRAATSVPQEKDADDTGLVPQGPIETGHGGAARVLAP